MPRRHTRSLIGFMLALGMATIANADNYDLSWHTIDGGGGYSAGGDFELEGTIGQHDAGPSTGTMTGGSFELVGGFWPGSVTTIVSGSSCMDHSPGSGEWCLELDSSPIEPRFDGVTKLEFSLSSTVSSVGASVSCDVGGEPGVSSVTPSGATVTIIFDASLPDQSCCTITLNGDSTDSFEVISLAGDISREGAVSVSDKALIKPKIGDDLTQDNFYFDVSCDGEITVSDKALIKPKIGHAAPACQ
ncbi:MAG: hypothetical protein ACYSVY_03660 [Planctomycetota bacterium]